MFHPTILQGKSQSLKTSCTSKVMNMSKEERRQKRHQRLSIEKNLKEHEKQGPSSLRTTFTEGVDADLFTSNFINKNESELLLWVANVNRIYEEKLRKPAPFMTFVLCGMQSTGKSTIMERFLGAPLNIVQEGTGTRCPLDCTCIHDASCDQPLCELSGVDLSPGKHGEGLTVDAVFEIVIQHNKELEKADTFSNEPLRLIFKSSQVQNMRFVDTPGIIANRGTGKDNREDIKGILRVAMKKPNTFLCVLLEPKEFATNQIIDFLDETFAAREDWISNATFLMTKFDKQFEDSRTGSKANAFFREYIANKCVPFLVSTPTLSKENLPCAELFEKRRDLLLHSDEEEQERFQKWLQGHRKFVNEEADELLVEDVTKKIGFKKAEKYMRDTMLEHTAKQLPIVMKEMKMELQTLHDKQKILTERMKITDPGELKALVISFLVDIQRKIISYLDGNMDVTHKFPQRLMTLIEEIDDEDDSEWSTRELNHHNSEEEAWRDIIATISCPNDIQPSSKFLGGKQVQRAIAFFHIIMVESIPDPSYLKDHVVNATGYGTGQMNYENWERSLVQTVQATMKKLSNPGINYLIKHIGSILRSLIDLAFDDVKTGGIMSSKYNLIPPSVEKFLQTSFEDMLWDLMVSSANKALICVEPMYTTIDPTLPTLYSKISDGEKSECEQPGDSSNDECQQSSLLRHFLSVTTVTAQQAKRKILGKQSDSWKQKRQSFLPEQRSPMMTQEEADIVIKYSLHYIIALMEFQKPLIQFQVNHYLYKGFRDEIGGTFATQLLDKADWNLLVVKDNEGAAELKNVEGNILALTESIKLVQKMQRGY